MDNKSETSGSKKRSASPPSTSHSQGGSSSSFRNDDYANIIEGLKKVYSNKIKQLETTYNFEGFHSQPLTGSDIEAKPIVLLMGQYSTGKTTFIKYLLEREYPGLFFFLFFKCFAFTNQRF